MSNKRSFNDALVEGAVEEEEPVASTTSKKRPPPKFVKELKLMMFGFGDAEEPLPESLELMDEIALEFITEMTRKALTVGFKPGVVKTEDIVFLIRRDPKKLDRVRELIRLKKEIQTARKMADVPI